MAAYLCQVSEEILGPQGRDGLPGLQIGIADAFFCVLVVFYDVVRQMEQAAAVGIVGMLDGCLIPGEIEVDDGFIVHKGSPRLCF